MWTPQLSLSILCAPALKASLQHMPLAMALHKVIDNNSCFVLLVAALLSVHCADNPPAMVDQILALSLARNIPVANYTVTVGFETTPQRFDQMQVGHQRP